MGKIFLESPFCILVFFHPGTCFAGFVESKMKMNKVTNHINEFYEPWLGISNNVVCATSKASDQPAHTLSLIRAFASRVNTL